MTARAGASNQVEACDAGEAGAFDYPTARMIRVLHLLGEEPDFQTRRGIEVLAREAGAEFQVTVRAGGWRRGSGGEVARLWRHSAPGYDVIHAWGIRALTTAAL